MGAALGPHIFVRPTRQIRAPALCPGIFIGDVSPTNVAPYILRCHITNEYIVKFIGIVDVFID
jgi:hypothetical protein